MRNAFLAAMFLLLSASLAGAEGKGDASGGFMTDQGLVDFTAPKSSVPPGWKFAKSEGFFTTIEPVRKVAPSFYDTLVTKVLGYKFTVIGSGIPPETLSKANLAAYKLALGDGSQNKVVVACRVPLEGGQLSQEILVDGRYLPRLRQLKQVPYMILHETLYDLVTSPPLTKVIHIVGIVDSTRELLRKKLSPEDYVSNLEGHDLDRMVFADNVQTVAEAELNILETIINGARDPQEYERVLNQNYNFSRFTVRSGQVFERGSTTPYALKFHTDYRQLMAWSGDAVRPLTYLILVLRRMTSFSPSSDRYAEAVASIVLQLYAKDLQEISGYSILWKDHGNAHLAKLVLLRLIEHAAFHSFSPEVLYGSILPRFLAPEMVTYRAAICEIAGQYPTGDDIERLYDPVRMYKHLGREYVLNSLVPQLVSSLGNLHKFAVTNQICKSSH